jgi:hypothetical protein
VVAVADGVGARRVQSDRAPGWHPDHINPNLQRYWDGSEWTAVRRWVAGKWLDEAPPVPAHTGAMPTGSANPYAAAPARPRVSTAHTGRPTTIITAGVAGLLVCSILLVLGSFTPWLSISIAGHGTSVSGTDSGISQLIGVNGWITFSAGILLFILTCMIVVSGEPLFRSVALVIALAAAGFAIYDLVRMLQKISQAASSSSTGLGAAFHTDNDIGWGLIVVVIGGIGAFLCAMSIRSDP